jgi:threonine dehydrogenase-like Zn-dependent dehydrogenase
VRAGSADQCETTQVRGEGKGAALFGYTRLYGQVPGGQAEATRVAMYRGAGRVIGVDLIPERLERARANSVETLDLT